MNPAQFEDGRKRLWNEIVMLHDCRAQYEALYRESEERIALLNACARWFFGSHQRILLRETILGISRLTDPPKTGRFANLSLDLLALDPDLAGSEQALTELGRAIGHARTVAADLRRHRDKYIAHLDYDTAVRVEANPLPPISAAAIPEAIGAIESAYRCWALAARDQNVFFQLEASGSVRSLLSILESSDRWREYEELRNRRDIRGH